MMAQSVSLTWALDTEGTEVGVGVGVGVGIGHAVQMRGASERQSVSIKVLWPIMKKQGACVMNGVNMALISPLALFLFNQVFNPRPTPQMIS